MQSMLWLGYEIGLGFGWRTMDALFLVAMLSMGALILALLWRTLVKLHSRPQIALLETLQSEKEPH